MGSRDSGGFTARGARRGGGRDSGKVYLCSMWVSHAAQLRVKYM